MTKATKDTKDLRSLATSRKREINSQSKWNPRWSRASGVPATKTDSSGTVHPKPFHSQACQRKDRICNAKEVQRKHALKKQHALADDKDERFGCSHDDSHSSEVSGSEGSNSPPPDDAGNNEILYSYDAARGPANGKQVFSMALTKAVKDFEDGQTTKLVKDQYEVVDDDEESDVGPGNVVEEDGYEMI